MGLTFSDAEQDQRAGRLRRVPDYSSRPVKLRLFVLVAAFILVLIVAEKARDPKSWQWFFALDERPTPQKIDNRLPPRSDATEHDVIVMARDGGDAEASDHDASDNADEKAKSPAAAPFDPLARAWGEGLKALWNPLDSDQRTILYRLLECAHDAEIWSGDETARAEALLAQLEESWSEYQQLAKESLADLDADEQLRWQQVLGKSDRRFREEVLSSLKFVAEGRIILPSQQRQLGEFLAELESLSLRRVKDDTPFLTFDDNQIWHHLFWKLKRTADADLGRQSLGQIPYAQLYRQPAQYRGKLVTVRGAVRRAYYVKASRNHLGIQNYYVFWLQPFESADTPLVVYSLNVPPGFPPLEERDGSKIARLDEEVTVHGYLFKRGAYAGQHGTYNAPLMLAQMPTWHPSTIDFTGDAASPRVLWQAGMVAIALAVVITGVVYWTSFRRDRRPRLHDERTIAASLRSLEDDSGVLSPQEALKQLEEQSGRHASET